MWLERYVLLLMCAQPWLSGCAPDTKDPSVLPASSVAPPAIGAEPAHHQSYALTIAGYNYTDRYIDSFDVNGQGGGNLFVSSPDSGGGGGVCCVSWWTGTKLPKKVRVNWVGSYCKQTLYNKEGDSQTLTQPVWRTAEAQISGPIPREPHYFEVHIYGDGKVEVAITERMSEPRLVLPIDAAGNRPGVVFDDPPCPNGYDRARARDQLR
mgnify:CR=1 FL=1